MKPISFELEIDGLGIIFYSPHAVREIRPGQHYLTEHYNRPEDVAGQINAGALVGFCTGSPGTYLLHIFQETAPDLDQLDPDCAVTLCLRVTENTVYFRDLYTLLYWEPETDEDIRIELENGCYEVTACTWLPDSGVRGDRQQINLYFNRRDSLPKLNCQGVPQLI